METSLFTMKWPSLKAIPKTETLCINEDKKFGRIDSWFFQSFANTIRMRMAIWINFNDITTFETKTRYWRFMNKKVISMNQYWSRKLYFLRFLFTFFLSLWCENVIFWTEVSPICLRCEDETGKVQFVFSLSGFPFCGCSKGRSGKFFRFFWKRMKYEK